jgi:dipeptidyl aminopeptidase/acylaminoacyl peptidase
MELLIKRLIPIVLALAASASSVTGGFSAQEPARTAIPPIETFMKGEEFVGREPSAPVWAVDGRTVYFRWRKPGSPKEEIFAASLAQPAPRPVGVEEILKNPPAPAPATRRSSFSPGGLGLDLVYDRPGKRALVSQGGGLWLLDIPSGKRRLLAAVDEGARQAAFSFDGKKAVFRSGDNLFLLSLEDGGLRQMTSFSRAKPPADAGPSELEAWYAEQQKQLFKEIGGGFRGWGRGSEAFAAAFKAPRRKPFLLGEGSSLVGLELAPDEKTVSFLLSESRADAKETIVPSYVTQSGFTETQPSHAKAAFVGRAFKAGLMDASSGEVKWVDFGAIEGGVRPSNVLWSPDGTTCLIEASGEDRKDAWIFRVDPASGKTDVVERVHDDAWAGDLALTNVFWWPDGRSLSYVSEKDGFAHLFRTPLATKTPAQLTGGRFEVSGARLSKDGRRIYLTSNEQHPGERHFYVMPSEGGLRTRLTGLEGWNEAVLSPDESALAFLHSTTTEPAELYLQPAKPGAQAVRVTLSTTEAFRAVLWTKPEVLTFKARDGADVSARLYRPAEPAPTRPAVVFIHGAGYLQNAHKGWSSYFREFMFHSWLAARGYHVLDVDYRGSAGYGRDVRTAVYRHMGGKDLDDVVDSARFLASRCGVAPDRIGCYGGSYGGFLTLMAMFKEPDVFRAGAALRPVTDWAHYHPYYTVDILNLPHKDPEAYKQSSPIYFAEGLKGALLICHGMVDTNVHFQDTVRLVQRLIELGKDGWQVAVYPVEDHSFRNASSWTDEYKRIFRLFEENLKD